jgi:putative restriction endonuclease
LEEVEEVRAYDWEQTTNTFNKIRSQAATKALLSSGKTGLHEWLITYPGRGYQQQVFRSALLRAYGNRCAVCSIDHPALLEAAHLKPWNIATAAERVDVRNGILLCRNHHAAFDRGLWRIELENGMRKSTNVQFGEQQYELPTVRTHELRLPREAAWQPLEKWLLWRRR